jgi:hypothetical protein
MVDGGVTARSLRESGAVRKRRKSLGAEQSRTGTFVAQPILGVAQGTQFERQAAAADAAGETVAELHHLLDPLVQPPLPIGGQLSPRPRLRRTKSRYFRPLRKRDGCPGTIPQRIQR